MRVRMEDSRHRTRTLETREIRRVKKWRGGTEEKVLGRVCTHGGACNTRNRERRREGTEYRGWRKATLIT